MNKSEFLRAVAEKSGATLKATTEFYEAYVEVVEKAMKKGEKVQLVGFGTYEAKKRPARTAKNPQTGKAVKVPACKAPTLKFGKAFKEALN